MTVARALTLCGVQFIGISTPRHGRVTVQDDPSGRSDLLRELGHEL